MIPFSLLGAMPWRLIGAMLVIVSVLFGLKMYGNAQYEKGAAHVQKQWDHDRNQMLAAHAAAIAKRAEENARLAEEHHRKLTKLKRGYANEIEEIKRRADNDAGVGLRIPKSVCESSGGGSSETDSKGSGGGKDRSAGTVLLPKDVTANLRALVRRADEIVAACRLDQQFIEQNNLREVP